jgi:hypothetical protein
LEGTFCLVKLKPKEQKDKNWLFFRKKTTWCTIHDSGCTMQHVLGYELHIFYVLRLASLHAGRLTSY